MKLINADILRKDVVSTCKLCVSNGSSYCKAVCDYNDFIAMIDNAPTVAITDKPLIIIEDKVVYITRGHINALLDYEKEQAIREVCDRIINNLDELHKLENEHGKK